MAESILFSFNKVDKLFKSMIDNDNLTTYLFDGVTNNFRMVLVESCPSNISDCLNADGTLVDDVVIINQGTDGDCALLWTDGVNNNTDVSIASNSIHFDFGDNSYLLKAAFLVEKNTGFVLAYSINNAPMTVTDELTLPVNGSVWSIYSVIAE